MLRGPSDFLQEEHGDDVEMKTSKKAEAILDTAQQLFVAQGFHNTGVDQIAEVSGVTKRTLYKHFGSKEGLIRKVLKRYHAEMIAEVRERAIASGPDARTRILTCFSIWRTWYADPEFSGCIFIKTLNEFASCSTELSRVAQRAKDEMRDFLRELAKDGGAKDPDTLAEQLQILLEGSTILAQSGRKAIMDPAEIMVRDLLNRALPNKAARK